MEKFAKVSEAQVTSAIAKEFYEEFSKNIKTQVIIVGGGPAGLMAGRDLAKAGFKVLIIEANNYLGGGFWIGGYLMNILTFRAPAEKILDEIDLPYKKAREGLFTTSGPHACSKLISAACDAGVKILNMTKFDDVVFRNNKVEGVVINWAPISALPRQISCLDPVSLEAKIVIDATGHDACVCRNLERRGILKLKDYGPMDINTSEDLVVEKTGEIYPGLIVTGMAVSSAYGIPRMGPTFGGMLVSGRRAAEIAKEMIVKKDIESLNNEMKPEMMEKVGER